MKKPPTPESVRLRMAGLCARSEQCESDIRAKILRAGLTETDCLGILDFLKRERFIDDARFARAYVRDKVKFAGWGGNKIRMGLNAKRIRSDIVSEALGAIDYTEYREAALNAARSKSRNLNLRTREDNMKLYRYLLSRGYESSISVAIIKELRSNDTEGGAEC